MMGSGEILVILVVILILFGGKRLPEFAKSLGKGIREFKKACNGEDESLEIETNSQTEKIEKFPLTDTSNSANSKKATFTISSEEAAERKAADIEGRDEGIAPSISKERSSIDALCSRPIPDEIVKIASKDA